MIKIATIEDEENIRQEIVRYIKKGIGSIEGKELKLMYTNQQSAICLLEEDMTWLFQI